MSARQFPQFIMSMMYLHAVCGSNTMHHPRKAQDNLSPLARPTSSPSVSYSPPSVSSLDPSTSEVPSLKPENSPISSEAPPEILYPSFSPSLDQNTNSPISKGASNVPTLVPSATPSLLRSSSTSPIEEKTNHPTISTTGLPSLALSQSPSEYLSRPHSSFPTQIQSTEPTWQPTNFPSSHPTSNPSSYPSSAPSGLPTLECHDNLAYSSPINALTCDDHKGTDCVQWRVLGLNTTELGALIENCPQTCNIPCGSFSQFSLSLSFRLSNIPGLLDAVSKTSLEISAYDAILEYVRAEKRSVIFELDKVELTSQSLVETNRQLRSLQDQTVPVSVLFDGFTVGLSEDEVSELIKSGINSPLFVSTLQKSDDFFSVVMISSASENDHVIATEKDDDKKGASTATVVISTLLSISICAFGIIALISHKKSGKWVPQLKLRSLGDKRMDGGSPRLRIGEQYLSQAGSPQNTLSRPASLLSFDESQGPSSNSGPSVTGLVRMMLTLSRSKSNTESDTSSSPTSDKSESNPVIAPIISPMSEETEESAPPEHPLASVIPPMIVIDNIESNIEIGAYKISRKNELVPSKRVEASSAFISSLRECQNQPDQSKSFVDMLHNINAVWSTAGDQNRATSPLGIIVDSDTDDDISVASTPVNSSTPKAIVQLRRSASSNALENMHDQISEVLVPPDELQISPPALSAPIESQGQVKDKWSISSNEVGRAPVPVPPIVNQLPPIHPSTPDKSCRTSNSPNEGGRINSMWSFSPLTKALKDTWDSTPRTSRRKLLLPKKGELKRNASSGAASDYSEDDRATVNSLASNQDSNDSFVRYKFEAPRKGQLGLVIEASTKTGPVVQAIKDYSPLFGLVERGDHIVEVDGKKTSQRTLAEITKLLAVRPGRKSSNLRIVVARSKKTHKNPRLPLVNHVRGNSYGSSSIGSSSPKPPSFDHRRINSHGASSMGSASPKLFSLKHTRGSSHGSISMGSASPKLPPLKLNRGNSYGSSSMGSSKMAEGVEVQAVVDEELPSDLHQKNSIEHSEL